MYHCFGCGEGGDVFSFRMRQDGTDFLDTVRALAGEFGVEIPKTAGDQEGRLAPLYELNDLALAHFRRGLREPSGGPARAYLQERGVPQDLIERFQLGYAPPGWDGLLRELGRHRAPLDRALEAGLIAERQTGDGHYDRFRSRLVFPITEPTGKVVGFGGRGLADETPKYLNTPESPIYRKGRALFGLSLAVDAIRQKGRAVVVEGYFDLIALHRVGIEEGVAPCGTALTADHARRLRRYTREVIMLFDGDEAGQRAAERSLPVLSEAGLRVRGAFLPSGDDPDTLLCRDGEEALRACVERAVPLIEHLIDERFGMKPLSEWEASDMAQSFGPLLAAVPDEIERASYERRIASRLQLPPSVVSRSLRRDRPARAEADVVAPPPIVQLEPLVRTLLGALGSYPDLVTEVSDLPDEALAGDGGRLFALVVRALEAHGSEGIRRLLSPVSEELPQELRPALSHALAESEPGDKAEAERAVRDCVARLHLRGLDRDSKELTLRLESCTDPLELERLLEQKQQSIQKRRELWRRIHEI
jgi:DNA primase